MSLRIVFMGTPDFAVPSLQALLQSEHQVVGVFTQPDRPKGRGGKVQMSPVKVLSLEHQIPVFQPLKIRKDGIDDLRALAPDLCVTAAFGQILSQEVLDVPRLGTVNVHASLLPRHRGSAPIAWAVLKGDPITGVTTMLTDAGIDTGDMLHKVECDILPEDTSASLYNKLAELGLDWDQMSPDFPHMSYRTAFLLGEDFVIHEARTLSRGINIEDWCNVSLARVESADEAAADEATQGELAVPHPAAHFDGAGNVFYLFRF